MHKALVPPGCTAPRPSCTAVCSTTITALRNASAVSDFPGDEPCCDTHRSPGIEHGPGDPEVRHLGLELGVGTGEHPYGTSPGLHRELPPPLPQQQGASSCRACRSCRALSCARGTRRWAHGHGAAQGAQMEGAALPPRFSRKHFHLANSVLLICMRVKLPCLLQSGLRSRH